MRGRMTDEELLAAVAETEAAEAAVGWAQERYEYALSVLEDELMDRDVDTGYGAPDDIIAAARKEGKPCASDEASSPQGA